MRKGRARETKNNWNEISEHTVWKFLGSATKFDANSCFCRLGCHTPQPPTESNAHVNKFFLIFCAYTCRLNDEKLYKHSGTWLVMVSTTSNCWSPENTTVTSAVFVTRPCIAGFSPAFKPCQEGDRNFCNSFLDLIGKQCMCLLPAALTFFLVSDWSHSHTSEVVMSSLSQCCALKCFFIASMTSSPNPDLVSVCACLHITIY